MNLVIRMQLFCIVAFALAEPAIGPLQADESPFRLAWEKNLLTIRGEGLPGDTMTVWYLEAYCRPGSTDRVWNETVIGHSTELISVSDDGKRIELQCVLRDGVRVHHVIEAKADGVAFTVTAANPTAAESQAHWAQPCIRVDRFTGRNQDTYLDKSFIFLDGKLSRMPTRDWATDARYVPGQVWCPHAVNRNDVNPRPLSDLVPSNGLIGCFSADETWVMASAWEPWQELFQGVIVCLHSDFRIGGLKPGQTKKIKGRLYLIQGDEQSLLSAYRRDFPGHHRTEDLSTDGGVK